VLIIQKELQQIRFLLSEILPLQKYRLSPSHSHAYFGLVVALQIFTLSLLVRILSSVVGWCSRRRPTGWNQSAICKWCCIGAHDVLEDVTAGFCRLVKANTSPSVSLTQT
jgi:hypothetical protein